MYQEPAPQRVDGLDERDWAKPDDGISGALDKFTLPQPKQALRGPGWSRMDCIAETPAVAAFFVKVQGKRDFCAAESGGEQHAVFYGNDIVVYGRPNKARRSFFGHMQLG